MPQDYDHEDLYKFYKPNKIYQEKTPWPVKKVGIDPKWKYKYPLTQQEAEDKKSKIDLEAALRKRLIDLGLDSDGFTAEAKEKYEVFLKTLNI